MESFEAKVRLFEKTPNKLVANIDDPYLRSTISACIHSQGIDQYKDLPDFLKVSAPSIMVNSLMSLPLKIISLQAYDGITHHFQEAGNPKSIKRNFLSYEYCPSLQINDLSLCSKEQLINSLFEISCAATDDMVNHVIVKIIKTSPKKEIISTESEDVINSLITTSEEIHESIGRTANFIIMDIKLARIMQELIRTYYDFDSMFTNMREIGVMKNRWTVFVAAGFGDTMIMGYRGHHPVDAGVVVSPANLFSRPEMSRGICDLHWKGTLSVPRPDYFRVINLSKKELATYAL